MKLGYYIKNFMVEANSKANQNKITEFVKDEIVYFAIGNQYYNGLVQTDITKNGTKLK